MERTFNARLIELMLECGALKFGEFTLKSGRKSPYFINAGAFDSWQHLLKLSELYSELIRESDVEFNVLFGPAYKGIPLAAVAGLQLAIGDLDGKFAYNRKEAKDHGEGGRIGGYIPKSGDRVAIIEDVTSAGTSVRETRELFAELGIDAQIVALYISVDRMERGTEGISATQQIARDYCIAVHSLATTADIVQYLEKSELSDAKTHAANIRKYLAEYGAP